MIYHNAHLWRDIFLSKSSIIWPNKFITGSSFLGMGPQIYDWIYKLKYEHKLHFFFIVVTWTPSQTKGLVYVIRQTTIFPMSFSEISPLTTFKEGITLKITCLTFPLGERNPIVLNCVYYCRLMLWWLLWFPHSFSLICIF